MQTKQHHATADVCVFIGRFQPLHRGHMRVIREGLARSQRLVVLVGSANEPRSFRNPFTVAERTACILAAFDHDPRLTVLPLEDSAYNLNEWLERTHRIVEQAIAADPKLPAQPRVALIGVAKDATSYYLNLFPRWASIDVAQAEDLSATGLRAELFGDLAMIQAELDAAGANTRATADYLARYIERATARARAFLAAQRAAGANALVPPGVLDFLDGFVATEDFGNVAREYAFVARYRHAWRGAPHPPTFMTADAVVIQSGHVLMVKRGDFPGKGLWALPGGFVDQDETIEQACLRELDEETAIKVPPAVLQGRIQERAVFDAPFRSSRGRTVTHAFLVHLKSGPLPKIKTGGLAGDEETQKVAWIPLAQLRRERCFEDHYSIITHLAARCRPVLA